MTKTEMLMAKSMGAGRSLKRKDKMNDDQISRQAALDCVTYDVEYTTERIKALPFLQPTCNQLAIDCISRQAALDAVFNNAEHPDKAYEAIRHLPSAQPEIEERKEESAQNVPKEDLISRKAAIEAECEVCQIAPKKERGHNCTYYVHGCKEN